MGLIHQLPRIIRDGPIHNVSNALRSSIINFYLIFGYIRVIIADGIGNVGTESIIDIPDNRSMPPCLNVILKCRNTILLQTFDLYVVENFLQL